ncbi:MAG: hypothetical protein J5I98_26080 [Phaeodactylibacter sp.]|nr:hypothetical protein [Phaeodactylibacter sp.]
MAHKHHYGMSELEREFELEMDDSSYPGTDHELEAELEHLMAEGDGEYEYDEDSAAEEYEHEYEEDEPQSEFEYDEDVEEGESFGQDFRPYGERLFELSLREFESESEMDDALGGIFDDMEREYFFSRAIGILKRNPIARSLVSKAVNAVAGSIPGGQVALDAIKTMGKPLLQGIRNNWSGAVRAGAHALAPDAIRMAGNFAGRLGLQPGNGAAANREAFRRIAKGIQRSYEFAAGHFDHRSGDPLVASRLANRAFEAGVMPLLGQQRKPYASPTASPAGKANPYASPGKSTPNPRSVRTVRLQERPGEEIGKIIIVINRRP